jgi:hypothetical protein
MNYDLPADISYRPDYINAGDVELAIRYSPPATRLLLLMKQAIAAVVALSWGITVKAQAGQWAQCGFR